METAAEFSAPLHACAHCGLPVASPSLLPDRGGDLFCCHACRLASLIVGKQEQGVHSWNLLRLGFGTLLAMNVMMISLLLYTRSVDSQTLPLFRTILFSLSAPALVILIPPFLAGAGREIASGKMSLHTLIAGGSLSAFLVSAVNTFRGSGEIYFDTATMLPVLVTVGKLIEASAKSRASDLLHGLESLLPATALRLSPGEAEEVPVDALSPGDTVRVRPGERIAVDGTILEGASTIEEAAFTGEFRPRCCLPGEEVIAGTVNGTGTLVVRAERTGTELLLHGIIAMIQDAWSRPSRAEGIAERCAAIFVPLVLAVSAASYLCWWLFGESGQGFLSALSVLVVACPCTMGIATPLATSLAIARAAKAGVVVRGGRVMEQMAGTEVVFFDKTGTITTGTPAVKEVVTVDPGIGEGELIGCLASLESASEHPVARAVIAQAKEDGIEIGEACDVTIQPGLGLKGKVTWNGTAREVVAGSERLVGGGSDAAVGTGSGTVIDVAWDGVLRGRLLLNDSVRREGRHCIEALARLGLSCVLLSGDRHEAALAVASEARITEVLAPKTPAQKLEAIAAAAASGRTVAMVGDGINDAPALAAAHTGIAMGGGMQLAREAGNVVVLSGNLLQIPWLFGLSRKCAGIIRQNFAWSFAYNSLALAAAAAGLLHPLLAAISMVISSVTVLANSLRISAFPDFRDDSCLESERVK